MSWDRELEDLMVDTVLISTAVTARTVHGVETWSSPRTVKARVVRAQGIRRDVRGESHPAEAIIWFRSTFMLSTGALVTVDGHAQPVARTEAFMDETGLYHHRVHCGWSHRAN